MRTERVLISEADPDVRRLLVVLVERQGREAIVLGPDVVVPPRGEVLLVDPVSPASMVQARRVREFFPSLPVLCLNPIIRQVGLPGDGPVAMLPKPFTAEAFDAALADTLPLSPV